MEGVLLAQARRRPDRSDDQKGPIPAGTNHGIASLRTPAKIGPNRRRSIPPPYDHQNCRKEPFHAVQGESVCQRQTPGFAGPEVPRVRLKAWLCAQKPVRAEQKGQ